MRFIKDSKIYDFKYACCSYLLISLFIAMCQSQKLAFKSLMSLPTSNTQSCQLTVANVTGNLIFQLKQLLVVICSDATYFFKTQDLIADSTQASNSMQTQSTAITPFSCPKLSFESQFQGSVTYLNEYSVYRASLDSTGSILITKLFFIDSSWISGDTIIDVLVTDTYTVFQMGNNYNFQVYARPKTLGQQVTRVKTGSLTFSGYGTIVLQYFLSDASTQLIHLYVSPNYNTKDNLITKYSLVSTSVSGSLSDVTFWKIGETNVKTATVSTIVVSKNFMGYGCELCNNYAGLITLYDSNTLAQILSVPGTSDNPQLGKDLTAIDTGSQFQTFFSQSNSGGAVNSRQYFLNELKILYNQDTKTYGYELNTKVTSGMQGTPHLDIDFGIYNGQVISKYKAQKQLFGLQTCSYQSYYTASSRTCTACSTFTLFSQNTSCVQCSDLWYATQRQKTNSYYQSLNVNFCKNFDPKTLPDYNSIVNGGGTNNGGNGNNNNNNGGGGNTNNNNNSTSGGDSSSGIGIGGIVAIVIVIVLLIGLAIGGYFFYKWWQNRKLQEVTKKKRDEKKEKQGQAPKRKNAKEFDENRIQKKMEAQQVQQYNSIKNTERDVNSKGTEDTNQNKLDDIQLEMDQQEADITIEPESQRRKQDDQSYKNKAQDIDTSQSPIKQLQPAAGRMNAAQQQLSNQKVNNKKELNEDIEPMDDIEDEDDDDFSDSDV
ncbi:UNKNOWN [Stylonychia lemnae]|uniref:Transmembrane protein n=1 Tax=Stylonychia lemnae TaxID=5949 RepID=A0A077ZYX0_STYLE|nr:UNKNOWN [Stylonychia lemnae]|eukprot:CDW75110.1 UNKNOWN [Stylonychia lemnae]